MNPPSVSVIIPTYNHQEYILAALDSVFAQTFTDYEVVVVNDGSPDNTAEILRPLIESGRIYYQEQTNAGQSEARNRGIRETKGEFIALLDDDDLWPPDKLKNQVQALQENPDAALVYGQVRFIDESGSAIELFDEKGVRNPRTVTIPPSCLYGKPSGNVYEQFIDDNYIVSPGLCLIRRSSLAALGEPAFDSEILGGADDWDLYLRLSQKFPFYFMTCVALYYRLHSSNASRDISTMLWSIVLIRRKMYQKQADLTEKHKLSLRLRDACTLYVSSVIGGGSTLSAAERIKALFKMAPYVPRALYWQIRESMSGIKSRMR